MQRVLVILTVILLVTASLAVGALAANWPFWQRAWQWRSAGVPMLLGPRLQLPGGAAALPLRFTPSADLARLAGPSTQVLLQVGPEGDVGSYFAPGFGPDSPLEGGALSPMLLLPVFARLAGQNPSLLDTPIGARLSAWRDDPRGQITPRQLFWQLSGLPGGDFQPLNPFAFRAQLASGPDFTRAALSAPLTWPPGSHFEASPVNAQLLSMVAAQAGGAPFAELVAGLWSRFARQPAQLLLDHPRGVAAAHCCVSAAVEDWLRLGLLLVMDGQLPQGRMWSPGFLAGLQTESPVHPGHGLGMHRLGQPAGNETVLLADGPGRQLLLWPAGRRVMLWIGNGAAPAELTARVRNIPEAARPLPGE